MSKPQGIVVYAGPSQIDGKQIVVIVTGWLKSSNKKTGKMLQAWIFNRFENPCEAYKNGNDFSICGDCKHRKWGTCYVNVYHAPMNIHKAYYSGKYENLTLQNIHWFKGYNIRLGAYGDPAAVPFDTWKMILNITEKHTAYTHQWRKCDSKFKQICMASVDNEKEYKAAKKMGWRTFRVRRVDEKLMKNEFICPASNENGHKTSCNKCLCCAGKESKIKKNPVIIAHGSCSKIKRYWKILKAIRQKKKYTHLVPKIIRHKVL